jgi:hypothetical protein
METLKITSKPSKNNRISLSGNVSWQLELANARKKFKRFAKGRCLSQELLEERAHER